jgi:hypothetical protein
MVVSFAAVADVLPLPSIFPPPRDRGFSAGHQNLTLTWIKIAGDIVPDAAGPLRGFPCGNRSRRDPLLCGLPRPVAVPSIELCGTFGRPR